CITSLSITHLLHGFSLLFFFFLFLPCPPRSTLFPYTTLFRSSMFYAVLDRNKLIGGFRNGCFVYRDIKYHYYSLNKLTLNNNPWTTGKIYIFPKSNFSPSDTGKIPFDEWICHDLVRPASQLEV